MRLLATALVSMYLAGMASAHAQPVSASAKREARSSKELADDQVEVMFLEVRAKKAKLLADIKRAETEGVQAPSPAAGAPGSGVSLQGPLPMGAGVATGSVGTPPASAPARVSNDAVLVSITSYDGRFRAGFDVDGHVVQRSQGEAIDGGWTVSRISETSVELKRNKQVRVLRM
jgi:type IV pilus biogenesis protein PilP